MKSNIFEYPNELIIESPPSRKRATVIFLSFWLIGWLIGEFIAIASIIKNMQEIEPPQWEALVRADNFFILLWVILWTIGGVFAIRKLLWKALGKEIITINRYELRVKCTYWFFFAPKTYGIKEVQNLDFNPNGGQPKRARRSNKESLSLEDGEGLIKFDYGFQKVTICFGVHEPEAKYLVDLIQGTGFLNTREG